MNAGQLLRLARAEMARNPEVLSVQDLQKGVFSTGGKWMFHRMQMLQFDEKRIVQQLPNFAFYGLFKYALSVIGLAIHPIIHCLFLYRGSAVDVSISIIDRPVTCTATGKYSDDP
jgi:hypothetical protein